MTPREYRYWVIGFTVVFLICALNSSSFREAVDVLTILEFVISVGLFVIGMVISVYFILTDWMSGIPLSKAICDAV